MSDAYDDWCRTNGEPIHDNEGVVAVGPTCDVTPCTAPAVWELRFPNRPKPWRYCGHHAIPHLTDDGVERRRIG